MKRPKTTRREWVLLAIMATLLIAASQDRPLRRRLFSRPGTGRVRWQTSLDDAEAIAAREHRPLFVEFSATWCGPCQEMAQTTYRDPDVADLLNDRFVPVSIDVDRQPEVALRFGVSPIPDGRFLAADGERPLDAIAGFRDADRFLAEANAALQRAATLPPLSDKKTATQNRFFSPALRTPPLPPTFGMPGF